MNLEDVAAALEQVQRRKTNRLDKILQTCVRFLTNTPKTVTVNVAVYKVLNLECYYK